MTPRNNPLGRAAKLAGAALATAAAAYAGYAALTWLRYGRVRPGPYRGDRDELLDRFMPTYEAVERHRRFVRAPAPVTLAAAIEMNLLESPIIRGIFKAREVILGATPDSRGRAGLLADVLALGWGVLAERPGREIVVGAVTKPWEADVIFRAIAADDFATFAEPDYVKIVWTLRADPVGDSHAIFRTETRAMATDAAARRKFRLYWAAFSPGIWLIRRLSLGPLQRDAERRALDLVAVTR